MARLTSHFYLFAHNARLPEIRSRRITQGYPNEGDGVQYTYQYRPAILAVANTVPHLGIPALFPILPELLAPDNGGVYHNALIEQFVDIRVLFIWEELHIGSRVAHHNARHVVHFQIFSEAPHCAGHLALVLLRLLDHAANNAAATRVPKLKDLTYSITPTAVFASAYFTGFEQAYNNASFFAAVNPYFTFTPATDCDLPLTTWPENRRDLAATDLVLDCYATVRSLSEI